ncbi:MAG: SDR family NAD(P)-dependent oxidoreductase [Pseudomonadota bacterium]
MDWSHFRVLVTGAGGFIGSHLAESLVDKGALVRAMVRYNSRGLWGWLDVSDRKHDMEVIHGDVRDLDTVREAVKGVEVVMHLASLISIPYSYAAPRSYVDTNITGTLNVLQAAREEEVDLVIHTSTSEVYGTAQYVPMDENHPLQAQSPYAAAKIASDKLAEAFHRSFGLPVVTVRPFNTFGPRQSSRAVIPTIVSQALAKTSLELGNLSPTRDLTYVTDTAEGFVLAAECEEAIGEVINLGTGAEISIGNLVEKILSVMNKDLRIVCRDERKRPEAGEVFRLCSDNSKARDLLGWEPKTTLEHGLEMTVRWIESNIELFRPETYAK